MAEIVAFGIRIGTVLDMLTRSKKATTFRGASGIDHADYRAGVLRITTSDAHTYLLLTDDAGAAAQVRALAGSEHTRWRQHDDGTHSFADRGHYVTVRVSSCQRV